MECQNSHHCGGKAVYAVVILHNGKPGITIAFCIAGVERLMRVFQNDPSRSIVLTALEAS